MLTPPSHTNSRSLPSDLPQRARPDCVFKLLLPCRSVYQHDRFEIFRVQIQLKMMGLGVFTCLEMTMRSDGMLEAPGASNTLQHKLKAPQHIFYLTSTRNQFVQNSGNPSRKSPQVRNRHKYSNFSHKKADTMKINLLMAQNRY